MSLESLMEELITVQMPTADADALGGTTNEPWQDRFTEVAASVQGLSAHQIGAYMQTGLSVSYQVFTLQPGILNGDRIVTSDGLILRVEGPAPVRAMGGIENFFKVLCSEVRP